jgi:N-acetylglucosamine-6-phosphate deacetylase
VATGVEYFDAAVSERGGAAYLPDGTLTGGVTMLDRALDNAVGLGVPVPDALAAVSARPAAVLGLAEAPGAVELAPDLTVLAVRIDGEWFGAAT